MFAAAANKPLGRPFSALRPLGCFPQLSGVKHRDFGALPGIGEMDEALKTELQRVRDRAHSFRFEEAFSRISDG